MLSKQSFSLKKNYIISIEGNTGVGKTTFLKLLSEALVGIPIEIVEEPVAEWQKFTLKSSDNEKTPDENILSLKYKDPKRWSYLFQSLCYITRIKNMLGIKKKIESETNPKLYIFERSVECDREIFAKHKYLYGLFNEIEWLVYNEYYNLMTKEFGKPMDGIIYLKAKSSVCLKRCKSRARNEEISMDITYLDEINDRHEEWLNARSNVLIINAEEDFLGESTIRDKVLDHIRIWLAKLCD